MKYLYITNNPEEAMISDQVGIDYVFIDLEKNGKEERQKDMDTVKSNHDFEDIRLIKPLLKKSKLLVRCNPIYEGTKNEINKIINFGADAVMLPYFKTIEEVKKFLEFVDERVEAFLLLETKEAISILDEVCDLEGIDRIHIGLNDLSISYGKKFMFELLQDNTVERIIDSIKKTAIPYGFGGVSALGTGRVPADKIVLEHVRLNSTSVILSRSFKNAIQEKYGSSNTEDGFLREINKINHLVQKSYSVKDLNKNHNNLKDIIEEIKNEK